MSQMFCNILVRAYYHVTKAVRAVEWYPLWLVVSWYLVCWHVLLCFTLYLIWKSPWLTHEVVQNRNMLYELKRDNNTGKKIKIFVVQNLRRRLIKVQKSDNWRHLDCKNLNDLARSGNPEIVDIGTVLLSYRSKSS